MNNYIFLNLTTVLVWGVINILPISGAWKFAKKITADSYVFLRISLAIFIYLLQCGIAFSLLGAVGLLSPFWCGIAVAVSGGLFYIFPRNTDKWKIFSDQSSCHTSTTWIERSLCLYIIFIVLRGAYRSTFIPGTDTYLYHLYYPVQWLERGEIYAISLAGLPHEYFPVFGEVLYGWFLLCGDTSPFWGLLQTIALIMALSACAALWKFFNISNITCAVSLFLIVSTGIIIENACLCYTDCLTGAFLVTGICFIILAFSDKIDRFKTKTFFALSGGLAMGISAAVKYSGLILAPVITLLFLAYFLCRDIRAKKLNKFLYIAVVVSANCIGWAYYMPNLLKTGNPFYPVKLPPFFKQGIDFSRETVELKNMWTFFVNDNAWDMNVYTAVFYILILASAIILTVKWRNTDKKIFGITAMILVIAEVVMLVFYPAMTQARQIIPFILSSGLLIAPVLQGLLQTKYKNIFIAILFVSGFFMMNCLNMRIFIMHCCGLAICVCAAVVNRVKYYKVLGGVITLCWLFIMFYGSCNLWQNSLGAVRIYSTKSIGDGILALRKDYVARKQHLRIAAVGTWFNYMLLLDMYKNKVEYVPINEAGTTHPHEVNDIRELRENPVPYAEWEKRLQKGKFTHLVIDLSGFQNFLMNPRWELDQALRRPEKFQLLASGEDVYFFRIVGL